jgi:hypothetical protein
MPQSKTTPHQEPEHASGEAEHVESALDEALDESFPASDPIAISFDPESGSHKKPPG